MFIPITYVRLYDILLSIGEGEPIQWRDNEKIQLYGCTLLCALILIGSDEQYKFARRKLAKLQIAAKSVSESGEVKSNYKKVAKNHEFKPTFKIEK